MKKILNSIRGGSDSGGSKKEKNKTKGGNSSKQSGQNKDGPNDLCSAAFRGDIEKAYENIKRFGVNSLDAKLKKAPLHFAARGGHLQMIKFLIDEGADPSILCSEGRSPLFSAIEGAHEHCANWLIDKGHCSDLQDKNGSTVLHYAAHYGLLSCFRKIYTASNNSISLYDKEGNVPVHVAVHANRLEIVSYICSVHSESLEVKTKVLEQTSLMLAVQLEAMDIITALLEAGCRTDSVDKNGTSVELLAKGRANTEIIALLNKYASQNNIDTTTVTNRQSLFENSKPNLFIEQSNYSTNISMKPSPAHQFDSKQSGIFQFSEATTSVEKSGNGVFHKGPALASESIVHKEQSDDDSEWGSNSEADGGQSKAEETFNADLKKRISQAFLLPISDGSNIFKSPVRAFDKAATPITKETTEGTFGREGTMKNVAETLVRNTVAFKSHDDEIVENEPELNESENFMSKKDDFVIESKNPFIGGISNAANVSMDHEKQQSNKGDIKTKMLEVNGNNATLEPESEISDWSDEEVDNEIKNSSLSNAEIDKMILQIDKQNAPIMKERVVKPIEDTTDSENDSSWDSNAGSPILNKESRPEILKSIENPGAELPTEEKVSNVVQANKEEHFDESQRDTGMQKRSFSFNRKNTDDEDDVINPEVTKRWVGVMSELTERVSASKLKSKKTNEGDFGNLVKEVSEILSPAEERQLFSDDTSNPFNTNIENVIPVTATSSALTCRNTSSEIFGEIEATPKDVKDLQSPDEMTIIYERRQSDSKKSKLIRNFGTNNLHSHATNDLNASPGESSLNTLARTLSSVNSKLVDRSTKSKRDSKSEKALHTATDSIPLSSLLNDDVAVLKKKISKKSYFNSLKFSQGKTDSIRKLSCPESNVPPSFLSKMKTQFSMKKSMTRGKSGSLPDVHATLMQDTRIEESEKVVCELLNKAKEILLSTATKRPNTNAGEDGMQKIMSLGDNQTDASSEGCSR